MTLASRLRTLSSVLRETDALRLLCEVGLPNDRGLWNETSDRIARQILPTPPDYEDLAELVARLFRAERDAEWLSSLPAELVGELMSLLAAEVLARGDVDHLLGDHAGLGPFVLRNLVALQPAHRTDAVREGLQRRGLHVAVVDRLDRPAVVVLDAAAYFEPARCRMCLR